jgi:O-antigen/teichoic acid export membrane protein
MLKNFSYLTAINLVNLAFPLFIIPVLLDKLGKSHYGMFVTGVALAQFFSVFIKLSFDLLGARDIALNSKNQQKKSEIYRNINFAKQVLFGIGFFFYVGFLELYYHLDATHRWVFYLAYLINISDIYYASWYFQGIEKMQNITIIGFAQKIIYLLGILLMIHSPEDVLWLMILQVGSILLVSILSNQLVKKDCGKLGKINFKLVKQYTKEAVPLSLPLIINMFKERIGYVIISKYLGDTMVAYYDIGDKIRQVICMPFIIINQVVYPKIAQLKSAYRFKKIFLIGIIAAVILYLFLYYSIDIVLIGYKKGSLLAAASLIKIMGLGVIPMAILSYVGTFLVPLNFQIKYYEIFYTALFLSVIHLSVMFYFNFISINSLIYGGLLINTLNAIHFIYIIYQLKIFKLSNGTKTYI